MTTIPLPWAKPPLTKNDTRRQGHHHAMRRKWSTALEEARAAIRGADVLLHERAVVTLHWRQPDNRRRDGDGAMPTLSACLDALVLEEVLPDDSWRYVVHSGVTCHEPVKGEPAAMWLTVRTPASSDDPTQP